MRALTTAAVSTTMTAETATGAQQSSVLKGKGTHRSWALLPEELVRYIATCYLWARASNAYVPATWEAKHHWHPRILYSSLRDAFHLERTLMCVCPQWGLALESHLFWQQAITLVDPTDSLAHLAIITPPPQQLSPPRPYRLSPYRHFRQIVSCSCLVCRINNPATSRGLLTAKRTVNSYLFGLVPLCREHEHRRLAFCGFCLRESQIFELVNNLYTGVNEVGVLENEDDETFPVVEATCRSCRSEWLWKKASASSLNQAAIGGPELCSDDWETRQSVDGFIELAEGTVTDVINLAREKYWLRKETRLGDMMQQALAAAKFNSSATATASLRRAGGAGYGTPIEWEEEIEEEEEESSGEEDTELMQLEEGGVKDLALGDWARTRILDGYWISPADLWYNYSVPGKPLDMPAVHPCPWTIDCTTTNNDPSQQRPQQRTVAAPVPPSFNLCEQAFISHGHQLRLILLPAMKNIVRRIAIECALEDSENENEDRVVIDPTLRASRMSLEDVMRMLREEEGVWYEGYDWVERRRNDIERERSERRRLRERSGDADEDDNIECSPTSTGGVGVGGGSSSSSVGSTTTSPVLSTTTLQTTPSPPPLSDNDGVDNGTANSKTKEDKCYSLPTAEEVISNKVLIPVEPVLNPPRVLRSIPYVPVTVEHFPQFTLEAFKNIWREACAPLYHCRCRICERAVAAVNASASPTTTQQQYRQPPPAPVAHKTAKVDSPIILQQPYQSSKRDEVADSPVQIQLQEVSVSEFEFAGGTEEGEEGIAEFENYDDEEEDVEEEEMYDSEDLDSRSSSVSGPVSGVVGVKRVGTQRQQRLEDEYEETEEEEQPGEEEHEEHERMKLKIPSPATPTTVSGRTRKRSSDEIEDKEDRATTRGGSPPKRQRKNGVDVENISTSTTRAPLSDALAILPLSVSRHGHHAERDRAQRKRSSEELDDDYNDDYDDHARDRGGHDGGGGSGEEHVSRSWKKKRQRIGDLNVNVGEEEGSRSEGRNSRSRSPTTPTTTTTTSDTPTTAGDDVDVDRSRSCSVTISEGY